MIGAHGTAERIVILKMRTEAEGKDSGTAETLSNDARVIALRLLIHAGIIFRVVLGDNDS